jgi:sulfotransferase
MKTIYMVAGLPRSGSTLLMNILGQNPRFYVTPTSGIVDLLVQVRNLWDENKVFCAMGRRQSEAIKRNVLEGMLQSYFRHTDKTVCIDKNRLWPEYLEMASALLGGDDKIKVIMTVRDLRDVLASLERAFRHTSVLSQIPLEKEDPLKSKTALGRIDYFLGNTENVGRAYNTVRDAVTRGWRDRMHFVEYEQLTNNPKEVLAGIYTFLGEAEFTHDFENVEQVTFEDDFFYGYKDLHVIRRQIRPQPPQWPKIFDQTVLNTPQWKDIEEISRFWLAYIEKN